MFRPVLVALLLAPMAADAAEFWLIAKPTSLMAEGAEIPMWGFAQASREQFGRMLAGEAVTLAASVPGPPLEVPAGETDVTVHLLNQLPRPVSLILHGRDEAKPQEAPASGGLQTYRWSGITSGSFLYESGTDPAFQVQMGLYGPLFAEPAAAPLPPARQFAVVFGEIDPGFHMAVDAGQPPASAFNYSAGFHFAEPVALDGSVLTAKDIPVRQGEPVLIRFYNAGLRAHAPVVSGNRLSEVAADGNPLPFPATRQIVSLPPGGTRDMLFLPSQPGRYALTDQGVQSGTVVVVEPAAAPQALDDTYTVSGPLKITARDKGVLANDGAADGLAGELRAVLLSPPAHAAAFALEADGTFSYTPQPGHDGPDVFHYAAVQDQATSGLAAVSLAVAAPPRPAVAAPPPKPAPKPAAELKSPQADDYAFTISRKQALAGVPLNVLAHAKTPNPGARLDPATIMVTKPAKGGTLTIDRKTGAILYKAPAGLVGANTFLYAVKDSAGKTSNAATITVTVAP